jgi:hypothetical protein
MGWEINTLRTTHYYRFLILDPTTNCTIIALFITYFINCKCPKISATYNKKYPIQSQLLELLQVDYFCPSMTFKHLDILNPTMFYTFAFNKMLNEYFPYYISTAVHQYQYYKNIQYTIQHTITHFKEKEGKYLKRAIRVLFRLENANFMDRLFAYKDIIYQCLLPAPVSLTFWSSICNTFKGKISKSTLDPIVNPFHLSPPLNHIGICIYINHNPNLIY